MKFDFLIRIETDDGEVVPLSFHTTRSKVDKLFFDLAFCVPCGNILRVNLYLCHYDRPKNVSYTTPLELLNTAEKHKCV